MITVKLTQKEYQVLGIIILNGIGDEPQHCLPDGRDRAALTRAEDKLCKAYQQHLRRKRLIKK